MPQLLGNKERFHCLTIAIILACVAPAVACAGHDDDEPAALEDSLQQDFRADAKRIGSYLDKTNRGENISEMGLGWFAYSLPNELSERDPDIAAHLHEGGRDTATYLKRVFSAQPEQEVAVFEAMAQRGHPTTRLIARDMLQALRFIPNGNDAPEVQAEDRHTLATALEALKTLLEKGASGAAPL